MQPVHFEQDTLKVDPIEIEYEWGTQQMGDVTKLIFHFFMKEQEASSLLLVALEEAGAAVPNVTVDVGYTEEVDGHHLIIWPIEAWQKVAIKANVVDSVKKALTTN